MKKIFFLLFFISGFCALLYQTVWLRLAFANFGINAQVISLVVSVFMLGLVLGSWMSGRFLIHWARKYKIESLYLYGAAEVGVGIGALVVPQLFLIGREWLLTFGQINSVAYISLSAIVLLVTLLPWCFLMGTTIPLAIEYYNEHFDKDKTIFSFLYLANTFGAVIGVIVTALFLIELLGFMSTLFFASLLNFLNAAVGIWIALKLKSHSDRSASVELTPPWTIRTSSVKDRFTLWLLFATGFSLVGFEIIWNRLFTPVLHTSVYAFAAIVGLYLFGTCLGLLHYRFIDLFRGSVLSTRSLLTALIVLSIIQVWFIDPRIDLGIWGVAICVGSIAYVLGYLTPKQVDELSEGNPNIVGLAYAVNLLGCIVGPLMASYVLLPFIGAKFSIMVLGLPLVACIFSKHNEPSASQFTNGNVMAIVIILVTITAGFGTTYEEWLNVPKKVIKNDYNATVLAATLDESNPRSKYLMVNGIGITSLTPITKVMAHLPLFALPEGPKRVLVICFGMGTTFRSMTSWGIPTTAVELTPSVSALFPYFFDDANKILAQEGNRIVIDDGRRFLQRTSETYDIVTIDPPPPVEAAGSSLLYSEEFYEIVKKHLTPTGILAQWYPEKEGKTLQAVARSLVDVFPYVQAYLSIEGGGYHFLASNNPITIPAPEQILQHMPPAAQNDLMEWNDFNEPNILNLVQRITSGKQDVQKLLNADTKIKITDDQPYNEYFLLHG